MEYKILISQEPFGKTTENIEQIFDDGSILCFPADPNNPNWQAYLAWLAEGNTPLPPDA